MKIHELEKNDTFTYHYYDDDDKSTYLQGVFLGCDGMYAKVNFLDESYNDDKPYDYINCSVEVTK